MHKITHYWYQSTKHPLMRLLQPLSWLFGVVVAFRQWLYQKRIFKTHRLAVPVIVVGNITVGGTGKTPFVIWLSEWLRAQGYSPGIVSRGYSGVKQLTPHLVQQTDLPARVGDEAILLAKRSNCPVMICTNRVAASKALLELNCNIIISDDGLQHYSLERDIEIVMVDGARLFGNQLLLPAGPLREPLSRLKSVDFVVTNGESHENEFAMQLKANKLISLYDHKEISLKEFAFPVVHAVAGIGHPQKFFQLLTLLGLQVIPHAFPDHHFFKAQELEFADNLPIVMTEKDAVKCQTFKNPMLWYFSVDATLSDKFKEKLSSRLKEFN